MANSVTVGTELSPNQAALAERFAEIEVYAGPGPLPEAIQEEFGNFHEEPHPFIRPAFDTNVRQAMIDIADDAADVVFDAAKRA